MQKVSDVGPQVLAGSSGIVVQMVSFIRGKNGVIEESVVFF